MIVFICQAAVSFGLGGLAESGIIVSPGGKATPGLSRSFFFHWHHMPIPSVVPPSHFPSELFSCPCQCFSDLFSLKYFLENIYSCLRRKSDILGLFSLEKIQRSM